MPAPMTRLTLFFYSTANIVGCLLALLVLALYFSGIIHSWWLPLTGGAYVFGLLAVPGRREVALDRLQQLKLDEAIDAIAKELGTRLPADANARLGEIQTLVHDLAPRCEEPGFPVNARIELNNAICRDLPSTLANYLALPPSFARLHPLTQGKTARELLMDQLNLFLDELNKLANNVYAQDANKLVSQGEYLKQKFRPVNFLGQ